MNPPCAEITPTPVDPRRPAEISDALLDRLARISSGSLTTQLFKRGFRQPVLVGHDSDEAVIEWTHWKRHSATAQRGDEWYVFDRASGLIREIRAYYAAPAVVDKAALPQVAGQHIGELVDFDYAGRGYHLRWE